MAIPGPALLALWHDIDPPSMGEYTEWHTREHMPERLSIPGFTVGKRLINHDLGRYRVGTIYVGESLSVFNSPAYLERLNNPSDWSLRVQPDFRNFLRVACAVVASVGVGEGGAVLTCRVDLIDAAGEGALRSAAAGLAGSLLALPGACGAHVALAREEVSGIRTRETELRPEMHEQAFDALVIVEGSGRRELEAIVPEIERIITAPGPGLARPRTLVHDLAYQLSASDLR